MSVQKELNPPEERTQAFFSATMPNQVQQLAADCLNKYIFLVIGIVGAANKNVDQKFFRCDDKKQKFKIVSYRKFLKTSLTQNFLVLRNSYANDSRKEKDSDFCRYKSFCRFPWWITMSRTIQHQIDCTTWRSITRRSRSSF